MSRLAQAKNAEPVHEVGDLQVVQPLAAQVGDVPGAEPGRGAGERHGGRDDGVPPLPQVRRHAVVEQALDVLAPPGVVAGEPGVHRGAVDAAVEPAGGGRGEPRSARGRPPAVL